MFLERGLDLPLGRGVAKARVMVMVRMVRRLVSCMVVDGLA